MFELLKYTKIIRIKIITMLYTNSNSDFLHTLYKAIIRPANGANATITGSYPFSYVNPSPYINPAI